MKKAVLIIATVVASCMAAAYWYYSDRGRFTTEPVSTGLTRTVAGNEIVSPRDPAAILRFAPEFKYAGGQRFVLYGVADTEQHFFVETDAHDRLRSVYWLQFEAYLPDKDYTYDYDDSPLRVRIGDYEFFTDTDVFEFDPDKKRRRGTDGAMARQLLANKGYTLPRDVIYARLVYLTDEARNKELMIIFMDALTRYGVTAAEINQGQADESLRARIEQAHLDRIRATLSIQ